MSFVIFDIDDAICLSPYKNKRLTNYISRYFGNLLKSAPVMAWIKENGLEAVLGIIKACIYISGRPEIWRKITLEWLKDHGFPEGKLICMGFTNRQQYIQDKLSYIESSITNQDNIYLVEDDAEIIELVRKEFPFIKIIKITGGKIEECRTSC